MSAPPLTQARLKEVLHYDPDTGSFRWFLHAGTRRAGQPAGNKAPKRYVQIQIDGGKHYAHRLAWLYVYGNWPDGELDHVNGTKADNRIANLRQATRQQQRANSRTSGKYRKGVYLTKQGKWAAKISKTYHLGPFNSENEANRAYADAAVALFGKFARWT
jgi:hypothetical protein